MPVSNTNSAATLLLLVLACSQSGVAAEPDRRYPLFAVLTADDSPTLVTYTPSQLDPRQEVNQRKLATSSIRSDLEAQRTGYEALATWKAVRESHAAKSR
jgi:hypothetical protein